MKEMITKQIIFKKKLYAGRYSNGQLAVFVHAISGEPIAELSIMHDSVGLAPNEFILKDYSENEEIAHDFFRSNFFEVTDRYVLIGSHLCPICQIRSEV